MTTWSISNATCRAVLFPCGIDLAGVEIAHAALRGKLYLDNGTVHSKAQVDGKHDLLCEWPVTIPTDKRIICIHPLDA